MSIIDSKVELLAPAGNFDKLKIAVHYGADAVYLAGQDFSLRNFSGNFKTKEIGKAVNYAHLHGVKVYAACNIYPRNFEIKPIRKYLKTLGEAEVDALIAADPGVIIEAKEHIPNIPIHLSTQANTTNYKSTLFWEKMSVKRINIARELSLNEIKEIAEISSLEIEAFVHGAMCISYSGRCLLSSFMTGRDSNRGRCSHPCRWKYHVVEEFRPGQYIPVSQDNRGTYLFSSKDLCMVSYIPEMIRAGISSLKIEGRMKGLNYLATTVKIYREAIDEFYTNPKQWKVKKEWLRQLEYIAHRGYCTGLYFDNAPHNFSCIDQKNIQIFIAIITGVKEDKMVEVDVKNKSEKGAYIEIMSSEGPAVKDQIIDIFDTEGQPISCVMPGNKAIFKLNQKYKPYDLIRLQPNSTDQMD